MFIDKLSPVFTSVSLVLLVNRETLAINGPKLVNINKKITSTLTMRPSESVPRNSFHLSLSFRVSSVCIPHPFTAKASHVLHRINVKRRLTLTFTCVLDRSLQWQDVSSANLLYSIGRTAIAFMRRYEDPQNKLNLIIDENGCHALPLSSENAYCQQPTTDHLSLRFSGFR